jgi:hypothetical protein
VVLSGGEKRLHGWDVEPPIKPAADGRYPAILPGVTKLG